MSYSLVRTDEEFESLCRSLSALDRVALDTEFIAEGVYRPLLCLVQIATEDELILVDTLEVSDAGRLWRALVQSGTELIVHAGRTEAEFFLEATGGALPKRWFDVQLAAGMIGLDYPVGFRSLVSHIVGRTLRKAETRTNWRKRPLTKRQIDYALDDVRYLFLLRDRLRDELARLGRQPWFDQEMADWKHQVQVAMDDEERWRRACGNGNLSRRELAVARSLWFWRESVARHRNMPVKRVLRDDLIIELSRRGSDDPRRIQAVRGMERGDLKRAMGDIAEAIHQGLQTPESECPVVRHFSLPPQLPVLSQLLFAALGSVCREKEIAASLVGSPSDVRELIAYEAGFHSDRSEVPKLALGWRADVVGNLFDRLLSGKTAIRVRDAAVECPLEFVDCDFSGQPGAN